MAVTAMVGYCRRWLDHRRFLVQSQFASLGKKREQNRLSGTVMIHSSPSGVSKYSM